MVLVCGNLIPRNLLKCNTSKNFISCVSKIPNMSMKPVEEAIRQKLATNLDAVYLDVINESFMHNVPKGAETHFKIVVVSDKFNDLALMKRHRLINGILKEELENGVHALSVVAKTPAQWDDSDKKIEESPKCRGGFGK